MAAQDADPAATKAACNLLCYAAEELPPDYTLTLRCSADGDSLELTGPDGEDIEFQSETSAWLDAVAEAKAHAAAANE